jgi:esterase/lipase
MMDVCMVINNLTKVQIKDRINMSYEILVKQFCTPPITEETDFDRTTYDKTSILTIEFEGNLLKGYSLGAGPNVLLVHGWGSRASHMALIARYIANNGFRAVVFDGPAHGDSKKMNGENLSNMFEIGRAISCVVNRIGETFAIIGHSIGGMAASFTLLGKSHLSEYKIFSKKLILINSPVSFAQSVENYCCKRDELNLCSKLAQGLENTFNFKISDYDLSLALQHLNSNVMMIHDQQDEEVPVADVLALKNNHDEIVLKITNGYGHQKNLINRRILSTIKEFLEN